MGGDSVHIGKRVNNNSDDSVLDHISLPISPQNLPLSLPITPNAVRFWLHFRHHLVGDCPQLDCLLCRIPCELLFPLSPQYIYLVSKGLISQKKKKKKKKTEEIEKWTPHCLGYIVYCGPIYFLFCFLFP